MTTTEKKYREPKRIFEFSGAVNPQAAYYVQLDNVTNMSKQDMKTMVNRGRYFSIFAPRQSGKTTFLEGMCNELHKDRTYVAVLINFQKHKSLSVERFYGQIQKELYRQLIHRLTIVDCEKLDEIKSYLDNHKLIDHISFGDLFDELNDIIRFKKIVIFIDE
ncbi:MAG: hypothetical protein GY928_27420, partial [Colwellia sp.]|nr:hypothetical protein [Colwellia sp.]